MASAKASIRIERPAKDVFAYASDPANMSRWQGEVLEAEPLSEGPLRVGSRVRGVGSFLGRRIETTVEITAFEPDQTFRFTSVAGPIKSDNSFTFESVDGGTRVTESAKSELAGLFGLADPLLSRALGRQFRTNLANLKDLMEAGAVGANA